MVPGARYRLECRSTLAELARVGTFVRRLCAEAMAPPLEVDSIQAIELAVHEAVCNIIRHAYRGCPAHRIQVLGEVAVEQIVFHCDDWGAPFRPEAVRPPVLDGSQEYGFGVYLMTQCADVVHFTRAGPGQNRVSLTKRRRHAMSVARPGEVV